MSSIAFLGLGRMGALMARRLVTAGHDVTVWNRTSARTEPLVAAGARAAATPAEAVAGRELVITMLAGPASVRDVFFGPSGAAGALKPGALVAEMSTIGPEALAELRDGLAPGVRLVDAPVLGSLPQAEAGELRIFLGGEPADTAALLGPLGVLGTPEVAGPLGAGARVKLVLNAAIIGSTVLLGELLVLADRLDVPAEYALDSLRHTALAPMVERIRDRFDNPDVPVRFSLDLAAKDMDLAAAHGPLPTLDAAHAQIAAARESGYGHRDLSSVISAIRTDAKEQ